MSELTAAGTRKRLAMGVAGLALLVAVVLWAWQGGVQALLYEIVAWQRDLHRQLTLAITALSGAPSPATWTALLGISFGYGVFHAAGPGHGKAVLSTYLLSQGGAWRRALSLSAAASLLQGLVAILLVAVLVHGLGWLTRQAMGSVVWVERLSFLMVTGLGLWLCLSALRRLRRRDDKAQSTSGRQALHASHAAHDDPPHGDGCGCGHEHHLAPERVGDWRTALGTVVAIGIRPCSGGVLLLGAASLLGQFWVGVVAVMVMAAGTALAVSALALASVMARGWAERRLTRQSRQAGRRPRQALAWASLAGGLAITALGLSLTLGAGGDPGGGPLLDRPAPKNAASPFGG
ncbi:sodium:proton antiporter [Halomonas sp. YLGW01]|uniref:nickel/cobalt transporter n=1 Tax=Halomonas sp. YLGW01 TaxID=2773308 RepID=UPI00177F53E9|nr:sodium:proton antiporter [Halomonas sp. YLGW01]